MDVEFLFDGKTFRCQVCEAEFESTVMDKNDILRHAHDHANAVDSDQYRGYTVKITEVWELPKKFKKETIETQTIKAYIFPTKELTWKIPMDETVIHAEFLPEKIQDPNWLFDYEERIILITTNKV